MKLLTRARVRHRLLDRPGLRSGDGEDDLIGALVHIHRLVLSGTALHTSIAHAVHIHPCVWVSVLHDRMSRGDSIEMSSRALAEEISSRRHPSSAERDAVVALHVLSVADSLGGRVADQLESLIETLHERVLHRRERRAQAASAAASIRLLTWLPVVCGVLVLADSPEIRNFLFGTTGGWICLVLGIASNLVGRLWLEREVASC